MSRFKAFSLWALLVVLVALAACQAAEPRAEKFDLGGSDTRVGAASCSGEVDPSVRIVDVAAPQQTSDNPVPVRGLAIGAAEVFAQIDTMGASAVVSVGPDGRFCVPVTVLHPNAINNVELIPLTTDSCHGQSTMTSFSHAGASGTGSTLPQQSDLALQRPVSAQEVSGSGAGVEAVVDGHTDTWTEVYKSPTHAFAWVRIDLGASQPVSGVRIDWGATANEAYWATKYEVLVSNHGAPSDPDPNDTLSNWSRVGGQESAPYGSPTLNLSGQMARWVAVVLYENNGTLDFGETFRVAEVQVFSTPAASQTGNRDHCP